MHIRAWIVVILVFLFMLINFADKAVIGLVSVPIMQELGLSHARFGMLGSAFFLLFSLSTSTWIRSRASGLGSCTPAAS